MIAWTALGVSLVAGALALAACFLASDARASCVPRARPRPLPPAPLTPADYWVL